MLMRYIPENYELQKKQPTSFTNHESMLVFIRLKVPAVP